MRIAIILLLILQTGMPNAQTYLASRSEKDQLRISLYVGSEATWEPHAELGTSKVSIYTVSEKIDLSGLESSYEIQTSPIGSNGNAKGIEISCKCEISVIQPSPHFLILTFKEFNPNSAMKLPSVTQNNGLLSSNWALGPLLGQRKNTMVVIPGTTFDQELRHANTSPPQSSGTHNNSYLLPNDATTQTGISIGITRNDQAHEGPENIDHVECPLRHLFIQEPPHVITYMDAVRQEFVKPSGQVDPDLLRENARILTGLGLIDEARNRLMLLKDLQRDDLLLLKIGELIQGSEDLQLSLTETSICQSSSQLWELVQTPAGQLKTSELREGILQFKGLKQEIQRQLHNRIEKNLENNSLYLEFINYAEATYLGREVAKIIDLEARSLRIANRTDPILTSDILERSAAGSAAFEIALSEALRSEYEKTQTWKDLIISEIEHHIKTMEFEMALTKILELNSKGEYDFEASDLKEKLAARIISHGRVTDLIAIQTSSYFEIWPTNIQQQILIATELHAPGFGAIGQDQHSIRLEEKMPFVKGLNEGIHSSQNDEGAISRELVDQMLQDASKLRASTREYTSLD